MCIGHGIRVAARAFVTFVKGRLKCWLLLFINIKSVKNGYCGQKVSFSSL